MTSDEKLLEPYTYLSLHPGKEIRTKLIVAFDAWLMVGESMQTVCDAVEMLHTASLLVDDVEDGSEMRRGVPGMFEIARTNTIDSRTSNLWCSVDHQFRQFRVLSGIGETHDFGKSTCCVCLCTRVG
jgi:geranylgeranyl pyrophosphate synthase